MELLALKRGCLVGLAVWGGFLLLVVACGGPAELPTPEPTPASPPPAPAAASHVDSDILEALRKLREAEAAGAPPTAKPQPTPAKPPPTATSRSTKNVTEPLYWPTFADFQVATYLIRRAIAAPFRPSYDLWFPEYAIVYAASECVAGRELSSEGFRAFVTEVEGESSPGYDAILVNANTVIGQILALSARGARLDCLNPYLHPTTGSELTLAVDLVVTTKKIAREVWEFYRRGLEKQAFSWLAERAQLGAPAAASSTVDPDILEELRKLRERQRPTVPDAAAVASTSTPAQGAQQGQSILQMFRDFGSLKHVEIPAQVTVPKNTRGLNVQGWAIERELWELRAVVGCLKGQLGSSTRSILGC